MVYNFDAESLLNYYKGIFINAEFERLTGINQKQLQHYYSGHRKLRLAQRKKIENVLHKLGVELITMELWLLIGTSKNFGPNQLMEGYLLPFINFSFSPTAIKDGELAFGEVSL